MPPPYISDTILRDKLADTLGTPRDQLGPAWTDIIRDANQEAGFNILSAWENRGYTSAQVDAWDRRRTFNIDVGLYWCYVKGTMLLGDFDPKGVDKLNRVKEISERADGGEGEHTLRFTAGGLPVAPAGRAPDGQGTAGRAGGRMSTDGYRFNMETVF